MCCLLLNRSPTTGSIALCSALPLRHPLPAPLLPPFQGGQRLLKHRRPQVLVAFAFALNSFLRSRCRAATKRLLKMLERKRVEANCVRMVQGATLFDLSDGPTGTFSHDVRRSQHLGDENSHSERGAGV